MQTCKKILTLTKGKVCGVGDWPFNYKKDKIFLSTTIPYLTIMDDNFMSNTAFEREGTFKRNNYMNFLRKYLFSNLLKNLLNLFMIPYLLKSKISFSFYKEQFFEKSYFYFISFFNKKYISTYKVFKNRNYYSKDLRMHRFFKNKIKY